MGKYHIMVNFLMCAKEVWNKCPLYVLWQHKKVMLMRLEYLEPKRIVTNSILAITWRLNVILTWSANYILSIYLQRMNR